MKSQKENSTLSFDGQRKDEQFLFMFRRHIISMRKGFFGILIIFSLSCLPTLIFMNMDMLWISLGGFVVGLIYFFYHFIMWYFTIYIVTDQRIRQITQRGIFGKSVIDLPLNKVQSINYIVPGLSGELFKFGTINVQTIVGDLMINNAERPDEIYNDLQNALDLAEKKEKTNEKNEIN